MALVQCNFFSETLKLCTTMNVILPQRTEAQIGLQGNVTGAAHPTLFLLHGLSDDHSIWLRRTSIERYVAPLGLAVVMPAVHRSFYADMKHGGHYWTFISREVPAVAREFFRLSDRREDTFVAGLSMGGFGAFKLALNCPEQFCAAASLSGAVRTRIADQFDPRNSDRLPEVQDAFGSVDEMRGTEDDLVHTARQLAASDRPRPKLYQCCGGDDFLLDHNHDFRDFIQPLGFDYTYEEDPGEAHEWGYWDTKIRRVLDWLPLKQKG